MARQSSGKKRDSADGSASKKSDKQFFGLSLAGLVAAQESAAKKPARSKVGGGLEGRAIYWGLGQDPGSVLHKLALAPWVAEKALRRRGEVVQIPTAEGPLWLLLPKPHQSYAVPGGLDASPYGVARDLAGSLGGALSDWSLEGLTVDFVGASDEEKRGFMVGLELGLYRFKGTRSGKTPKILSVAADLEPDIRSAGTTLGCAVNLARHLVNLPANELNPTTFAWGITALFEGFDTVKVDVWTGDKLTKEKMGLLQAVGGAAAHGPSLVHIRYRPQGKKVKLGKPIAFVGKGITFDSGGLDIKDAGSMRLMKKDMGGAATVTALAHWVAQSGLAQPCDFYLALAENAIGSDAFRPGDIIPSRQGLTVEIDNTDAEGRLVLADALDVALGGAGSEAPAALIDVATLTGAMRVALGTRVGGLFVNDDALAQELQKAAQTRSDPVWRMPLVPEYMSQLKSTVADMANSGASRFGGAISAALFLQKFVGQVPWAHFDVYCWNEGNGGGCMETGGSGQAVQLLAHFLEKRAGISEISNRDRA